MNTISAWTGRVLRGVCLLAFGVVFALMVAGVANRFYPLGNLGWSDEIIELAQVWMVFLGSAEVWRRGQHFRVEILPLALRGTLAGRGLDLLVLACSLSFLLVFTWESWSYAVETTDFSAIFAWPRWLWYAPLPIAGALMTLVTLAELYGTVTGRPRLQAGA